MKTRNNQHLALVVALSLFASAANADSTSSTYAGGNYTQAENAQNSPVGTLGTDRGGRLAQDETSGTDRGGVTDTLIDWLDSVLDSE